MEATVLRWLKAPGDLVAEEESLLEVATDKVDSEVPAPCAGRLQEVLAQPGTVVKIGAPVAIMAADGEVSTPEAPSPVSSPTTATSSPPVPNTPAPKQQPADGRFYSPLVRHIAQEENIPATTLSQIPGTGQNNRVTKRDLLAYLQHSPQETAPVDLGPIEPGDEVILLDRVRQMIAARMVASKQTIPHVTSFVEADVTALVQWRHAHKAAFEEKTGTKLTYTPMLLQAVVRALKDFPKVNAWMGTNRMVQKEAIHLGMAVALPDGNLIVPVIRHADQCSLAELAHQVQTLAHKARHQLLVPDELAGATYTVSNLGAFQNLMGTPIIMQPQVAILALGAIVKRPAVVEDTIAIRHKLYLSHAYDHRVIDGALGGGFVKRVAEYLETFADWVAY